jgi:hypothetical protein
MIRTMLILLLLWQQQKPTRVPKLTTEDVLLQRSAQVVELEGEQAKAAETDKQTKADKVSEVSPEELAWREKIKAAREKAEQLERAAEEAELMVTELRNQLGAQGQTVRERNQTAAELQEAGRRMRELRERARAANQELKQLEEEGRAKRFVEVSQDSNPTAEGGQPNEDYYRQRYLKLLEALQTAERRIRLYENRIRDLNQQITTNSVTGDNFYIMRIQQERDEAQQMLQEALAARQKALSDIESLKEEARRAGIPPGIFR